MKQVLVGLGLLAASSVFAQELPSGSQLTLVTGDGVVVGVGEMEGAALELELQAGFSGFAELTVLDDEGNTATYEVMIGSDGSVVLTTGGAFTDIRETVVASGGTVEVSYEETIEASADSSESAEKGGEGASGESEGEEAHKTGLERAREVTAGNENANRGLDRADEAKNRGKSKDDEDDDGEDGEDDDGEDEVEDEGDDSDSEDGSEDDEDDEDDGEDSEDEDAADERGGDRGGKKDKGNRGSND